MSIYENQKSRVGNISRIFNFENSNNGGLGSDIFLKKIINTPRFSNLSIDIPKPISNNLLLSEPQQIQLAKYISKLPITNNTITLDQVVASLNAFKKSIYDVNYLTDLINKHSEEIIEAKDYASVLKPIIDKKYYNNPSDIAIRTMGNWYQYYSNIYPFWDNKSISEVLKYNSENNLEEYNITLPQNIIIRDNAFKKLQQQYPNNTTYYHFSVVPWKNSLNLRINYFCKDILNPSNYITVVARCDLSSFIPNTNDLLNFSEEYLNFINILANEISILNSSDWEVDAIWPYIFPPTFSTATCLYSKNYPEWNGKLITDCFIPGSDIDVPSIIFNIINDLYFNYPPLLEGQVALSTYNIGNSYYVSFIKITTFTDSNGTKNLCFKEKQIEINQYFPNLLNYSGDTTIKGSFNIKTYNNEDVIKTDNVSKITSFRNKIGVNQNTYDVKGLLDIDNVSFTSVSKVLNKFVRPLLHSNDVVKDISPNLTYNTTSINIPISFEQNIFVFKTIIANEIKTSDISFLYTPTEENVFKTKTFSKDSFIKIQNIVNELSKMITEINLNENTKKYTFSFIELLNDTKNNYLCSLRGVLVRNPQNQNNIDVYFITSFLDVNFLIINDSYTKDFINVVNKMSSCSRLLNFTILLMYNPTIFNELLNGNSIGSDDPNNPYLSDVINNSPYFRDRFGDKNLFMYGYDALNNIEMENNTDIKQILSEQFPYYSGKNASELFLPNTGYSVHDIQNYINKNYIKNYGANNNLSFLVSYQWTNGPKFSLMNNIIINNKNYTIGCGFNLSDILSESIVLKGDNKITGNLSIIDNDTNNTIFNVDTFRKENFSLYPLGLGTNQPKSKLDIKNGGVTNIINSINSLAKIHNNLNNNIKLLINASSESEFANIIQQQFLDYNILDVNYNPTPLIQKNDSYVVVKKIPNSLYGPDTINIYHWLYPNWNNLVLKNIKDIQNRDLLKIRMNNLNELYNICEFFMNSIFYGIYDWTFGKKFTIHQVFENNNQLYMIHNGVNLEKFGIDINDVNMLSFYYYISAYTSYLQDIYVRKNNIPSLKIINQEKANDYRNTNLYKYPIQIIVQYTIDLENITEMTISDLNYETLAVTNTQVYKNIKNMNLLAKLGLMYTKFINYYSESVNTNSFGILAFEDKYDDFCSVFWIQNVTNNIVTIISLELKINSVIQSTLNVNGDVKIQGDTYFSNANNDNYAYIDTQNKFMGINSMEILNQYNSSISNIAYSKLNLSSQNVVVTSDLYPNFVADRNAVNEKYKDTNGNNIPDLTYFVPLAPITLRRTSENFSFQDLYNNAINLTNNTTINTGIPQGFITMSGKSTTENPVYTNYKVGPSISYEVKDNTGATNILGRSFMVIDKIENNTTKAGFGIQVNDIDNESKYRDILYVNNDSQLKVNSIMLGGHLLEVDSNGNLLFDKKKVALIEN